MAQLVAHLHGMQGVRGSSPLISTNHHLVLCDQVIICACCTVRQILRGAVQWKHCDTSKAEEDSFSSLESE